MSVLDSFAEFGQLADELADGDPPASAGLSVPSCLSAGLNFRHVRIKAKHEECLGLLVILDQ